MKICFFGYHKITTISIQEAQKLGHTVRLYVPNSHRQLCGELGFSVLVPKIYFYDDIDDDDLFQSIKEFEPDILMSVIFGSKVPESLISIPKMGAYNFHPAKLPEFRSGNAWFWPIRLGATASELTVHKLVEEFDAGDVLLTHPIEITSVETQGIYHERVIAETPKLFNAFFTGLADQSLIPMPQDERLAAYYPRIRYRDIMIDWSESAAGIDRLIRACNPYHFAQTMVGSTFLELVEIELTDRPSKSPGAITIDHGLFYVGTGDVDILVNIVKLYDMGLFSGPRSVQLLNLSSEHHMVDIKSLPSMEPVLNDFL